MLRPTWHFVAAADLRWLLRLTGARIQAKNAGRYRQLGLDAATLRALPRRCWRARSPTASRAPAASSARRSRPRGSTSPGSASPHTLAATPSWRASIASGPRRGKHHTYLPLDGRVPAAPGAPREEDVAELVRRYFTSHGPATLRDFAWWSGLTIADAQGGARGRRGPAVAGRRRDGALWIAAADALPAARRRSSGALLLGTYDEALVAYRDLRNVHADGRADNDAAAPPDRHRRG